MLIPVSVPLLYPEAVSSPPLPSPIPIASLPLLLSAPSFMPDIYNIGAPEQFQTLFGTPRTRSPSPSFAPSPHRGPPSRASHHAASPPLSFDKFIHIPTRKISRGNSVNLEREREKERGSLGRYKRKEERKERSLTGEFNRRVDLCRVCGS